MKLWKKGKTAAQKPDDLVSLVLRNQIDHIIGQSLRVAIYRRDLAVVVPGLQQIVRNGLNPGFQFEVKDLIPNKSGRR
ncbi:MAG: hypothetical protein QXW38_08450 [Candidatus Nitrosotenuis sp.]